VVKNSGNLELCLGNNKGESWNARFLLHWTGFIYYNLADIKPRIDCI